MAVFGICLSGLLAAAVAVVAPFDPEGGHIQGLCEGDGHYYLSQMTRLFKVDRAGRCVKSVPVVSHTGDLCFRDGKIYTSVSVYGGPEKGKGKIQVFDTDLNLVREATFDRGLDGIAFFNGALYAGRGAHLESVPHAEGAAPESKTPHRENDMLVIDPDTLAVRARRAYSHGHLTKYGAQNMTTDGKLLYVTFYPGEPGAPDLVAYDADLRPVARYTAHASNGLQFAKDENGRECFIRCVTGGGRGKPIAATIERIDAENGVPQVPRASDAVPAEGTSAMRTEASAAVVKNVELTTQFVVCGGGMSGICAALAAARHGAKVVLVQDRPVLGGNASSEMRMGIMGAHGDENKEAGILEELQLKNFYFNPLRRYTLWDDVLYSAVIEEKNITLLLNTSVDGVEMSGDRIAAAKAWNGNAYTRYVIRGRLFADCTGDGILRLSGARYRHGREDPAEFGETFQQGGNDGRTMGNSILLQLRRTKEDHPFHAPAWAYRFTDADFAAGAKPKANGRKYSVKRPYPDNNNFWWIEFGGNFDTIGDANAIQLELKKIAYGVWDYIKNHHDGRGKGYDLDWIGSLPGKRESVRFIGPKILTQHDVMSGGHFEDVVAYGGWTLDDHHPDAFWHPEYLSQHHQCPSPFGIPFDCLYSVNVPNLMFAGRDISVTHMALSATRVMATCAMLGQAVGTAAAIAVREKCDPAVVRRAHLAELQSTLEDDDCRLPFRWRKVSPLTAAATADSGLEPLRNGIDRALAKSDNGVWLKPGATNVVYAWTTPQMLSGARLVFDSVMKGTAKRMLKLEAESARAAMPKPLAKEFRIEVREDGVWKIVFEDKLNLLRFRKIAFPSVEADAMRLVVSETWGGGDAHVFAFDAL